MHVTPADMPWVVSIGYPRRPPKYGGRKDARRVAVEGMQMWEQAIQPHVPWFRLEFVEDDPTAAVQVEWKRRITGPWAGFGGFRWQVDENGLSTTPSNFSTFDIDELSVLFTHEFGHVLGLGHCLDCDSAMNYAWNTRDRVFVTGLDVRTFLALLEQPNAVGGFTTATSATALPESQRAAEERGLTRRCLAVHTYCENDSGQEYSLCMSQQGCGPDTGGDGGRGL